jgi:hypothetical protein
VLYFEEHVRSPAVGIGGMEGAAEDQGMLLSGAVVEHM